MTTNVANSEVKVFEEQRFDLVLYINDNIICQRNFNIRNFNEDSLNSYEFKELIDNIAGMNNGNFGELGIIPKFLKDKAVDYLWNTYNPYSFQSEEAANVIPEKLNVFKFEIMDNKRVIIKTQFYSDFFPPNVGKFVNIKEIIPTIMNEIRYALSQKSYTSVLSN